MEIAFNEVRTPCPEVQYVKDRLQDRFPTQSVHVLFQQCSPHYVSSVVQRIGMHLKHLDLRSCRLPRDFILTNVSRWPLESIDLRHASEEGRACVFRDIADFLPLTLKHLETDDIEIDCLGTDEIVRTATTAHVKKISFDRLSTDKLWTITNLSFPILKEVTFRDCTGWGIAEVAILCRWKVLRDVDRFTVNYFFHLTPALLSLWCLSRNFPLNPKEVRFRNCFNLSEHMGDGRKVKITRLEF
ncbi:MAG: hypothetical protein Q8K75_07765 [Chlamydiales bacterium]|nr:hypothetical protein [Chlamydiales bacterium]